MDVIGCGITRPCSHTWFLRFGDENLSANQIVRFFKLVYLLNHLTVFCNFLHDGRKPLGEETEYALVVTFGDNFGKKNFTCGLDDVIVQVA